MPASLMSGSSYITVEKMTGMSRWCAISSSGFCASISLSRLAPSGIDGVGKAIDHVDHDQRRPLAEADLDAKAALPEKFLVVLAAGHDPHSFSPTFCPAL